MTDQPLSPDAKAPVPEDTLMERYGTHLDGEDLSEAQKRALLMALWTIMQVFVDLGCSVAPGDKFSPKSDVGMDDVLHSFFETAAQATAPLSLTNNNNKEI